MAQHIIRKLYLALLPLLAVVVLAVIPLGAGMAAAVTTWTQTTRSDFESGTLVQLDTSSSPGDVILAKAGSGYLYAFRGKGTKTFWRYDIATNTWAGLHDAPQNIGAGGSLAYDGGNYIYALAGGGTKYFWRYDIAANTWSSLASVQYFVNAGGALAYDGGQYIYALRGGSRTTFWRYSIPAGTWSTLKPTLSSVNGGGALAYGGGDFIYALGGMSASYWQYQISLGKWTSLASTPSKVGDGGALAYDGGNYIYALKGDNTVTFWRYNISGNTWTTMADTPATPCVWGGGALAYDKNAHLYALRGNEYPDFWKYDVAGNAWSVKTNTPATVAYGGALAYKGAPYYNSGDLASSAYDTGSTPDFINISWTATTPLGTAVKFQIATNNDNDTWVFKGPDGTTGTYYTSSGTGIWVGHDGNRYIKYKAFLSTTNTNVTPVLHDVSITFTPLIALPSATTGAATLVEETTATLNGAVANDGGEACQYRFEYGTASGVYTMDTGWTGSKTTGQTFYVDVTGLAQGTMYYYRAQVKNTVGIGSGSDLNFLTKPEAPTSLMASAVSGTQIDLNWIKGTGAVRTKVLRKTGSYPANYIDGTQVYFNTGTVVSDIGLSPGTMYYYRAWSEVTVGSSQQWSDGYASASVSTSGTPSATTSAATLVEETTATLNGSVANDGGEACMYRFEYDTVPGVYTMDTGWMGIKTTGQTFYVDVTGLAKGTKYYFRAQVKNSAGIGTGGQLDFLTKPDPPLNFTATAINDTEISLTWTKGEGALNTAVYRKTGGYPVDRNDGVQVYFNTGTSFTDTGLTPETLYYYRAWSEVTGSQQWSDGYRDAIAQTNPGPTVPPVAVGGVVYPVNKAQLLAPWLTILAVFVILAGGVVFRNFRMRKRTS